MNKTILITGAAKRIGREMALSFFNKGWDVVIHFNNSEDDAKALADEMNSQRNGSAIIVQANLDNVDEIKTLAKITLEKNQRIDALINMPLHFTPLLLIHFLKQTG